MNKRGDTMVEVLIAVTIIAIALAGAFAASRKAQVTSQRNDERSSATSVLEDQVERLYISSAQSNSPIYDMTTGDIMCFPGGAAPIVPNPGMCAAGIYTVWFENISPNTFGLHVRWEKLGNDSAANTMDELEAYYRVYPQ